MSYVLIRNLRRAAILSHQIRYETTVTNVTQDDFLFRPSFTQWTKVIREAEKIVGYPTSFMNLRWLLSDEFANMAMHLRKVVGSNHPIIHTAKTVIYNEQNNLQPWGLVILLLSKALKTSFSPLQMAAVNQNQRILAELTEMIRTGHYIHRGLLNIPYEDRNPSKDTALFANKIAILIGDYLLITANGMLARLRNQDLSYLISTALRDLSEGEFFGDRDDQNIPLPGRPLARNIDDYNITSDTLPLEIIDGLGTPVREWTLRTMYNGGSLFGRGCQGTVVLSGGDLERQDNAFMFGCHLCLAWQAASELQKFLQNKEPFSLVSAPVLFALSENNLLYDLIEGRQNASDIDLDLVRDEIVKTEAIEKTRLLYETNALKAQLYIEMFGDCKSIDTIKSLIRTL